MAPYTQKPVAGEFGGFVVPGTCFVPPVELQREGDEAGRSSPRNSALRTLYATAAMADVPRLLGAIDRNPYRRTYGCLDRQFWHYRTAAFPSEMYQEGALPLALVYATMLPGNRWYGNPRLRELAIAAIRFAAESSHTDGSCDDYYPFERAFGAAVFSLQATARAYQILELDDPKLLKWFKRRADWIAGHDESGKLANHHAMAALGLLRVAQITGLDSYQRAARQSVETLLDWQSDEGWFEEYGGADPGYHTLTIDCLAKYARLSGDTMLDKPLRKAVDFARWFLHPDGSYAGEYGSRGTFHFYPHGMELLAADNRGAIELAEGFLHGLSAGKSASFGDDRMFIHRLGNLIEAYSDWLPTREERSDDEDVSPPTKYFDQAGLLVRRAGGTHTIISAARGGVFKHFGHLAESVSDAGLIVEMSGGGVAVSQMHDRNLPVELSPKQNGDDVRSLEVACPLCWTRFETATPIKQAVFHVGMSTVGRCCRTLVRRIIQRRLITGRRQCPVRLKRSFEFLSQDESSVGPSLRVSDTIELTDQRARVRRMSFGTDHQAAYVAAANVYQEGVLALWQDLDAHVDELNTRRRVTVVREFC
jgi:hypothetical protein